VVDGAVRGVADAFADGSGVMMLTGGIDADVGNSASVGLPVGIDTGPGIGSTPGTAAADSPGALQDEA
jgi:hypothetical protein